MPSARDDRPYLTEEGRRLLEERVRDRERTLEELRAALGDPEESAEIAASCQRLAEEIDRLRSLLDSAGEMAEVPEDPTTVELGDRVGIRFDDGTEESYVVVHGAEAIVDDERISVTSPLGRALLGRRVGDTVEVEVPAGAYRVVVTSASRP